MLETADTQKKAAGPCSEVLLFESEREAGDRHWPSILGHLVCSEDLFHYLSSAEAMEEGKGPRGQWRWGGQGGLGQGSASRTNSADQLALFMHLSFVGIPCC